MRETILIGRGKNIETMPRKTWELELAGVPSGMGARLAFMTKEHHRVRNFVVRTLPRTGEPIRPEYISSELNMPRDRAAVILDELERHLFFLVRNHHGEVSWAFPVTAEKTGHQLIFSTGERLDAA